MTRTLAIRLFIWSAALAVAVLIAACAVNPATGEREVVFMSEEQELALGREYHKQILAVEQLYDDRAVQEYVQSVGERVAANADRSDLIYRFFVIDSPQVNAFALPGGYIYIYRGLIAYMDSEAELAAVLGHELGHVTARHAVRQHRNATFSQLLAVVVAGSTGSGAAGDLTNVLGSAFVAGYGRELELEADRLGAGYLARAGYAHDAMLDVLDILKYQQEYAQARAAAEGREVSTYHGVFASHPRNDTRLQEVVAAARDLVPPGDPYTGRDAFLEKIDGLVYGFSAQEGIPRGDSFYHPDLGFAFDYPPDWRLENQPSAVLLFAPEGKAVIQIGATDLNKRLPPAEFVRQRLGVENPRNEHSFQSNGLTAYTALVPQGGLFSNRIVRLGVVYLDDRAYIFQSKAEDGDGPAGWAEDFRATVTSFRRLTTAEADAARPWRIRVRPARPGDTYAGLAAQSPLGEDAAAQLRLLNQHYPDGEPRPGEPLKYVE
jgi:predicted Zn-dependent protease